MNGQFVITVASEKGGVGKTTIATNLAVYLKALREDLPVTITSFDNHFSVDQMFALGPQPDKNVADLFTSTPYEALLNLGQYGVQYIASSKNLQPPDDTTDWLSSRLAEVNDHGVLILDTKPVLDWFSQAALLAADVVLVPIKDRAALINAETLRQVLQERGRPDRLWLLPSLVDTRARLNAEVKVHEFLVYAARERDYQVMDLMISKSPKVEGLASGFSSNIRPVLTHARNTAVHGQFRQLAEFILQCLDQALQDDSVSHRFLSQTLSGKSSATGQRFVSVCPLCGRQTSGINGHFFLSMRSRRRGYIHPGCYQKVIPRLNFDGDAGEKNSLVLILDGPGLVDMHGRLVACLCANDGKLLDTKDIDFDKHTQLTGTLEMMTGRILEESYRELVVLDCACNAAQEGTQDKDFCKKRRLAVREIHKAGLI